MKLTKTLSAAVLGLAVSMGSAFAADYEIDKQGAHAFVQFKISHLGYSWLYGRFNDFSGTISYDENKPEESKVSVVINTASVDSNHAERDKHLRAEDFLYVSKYPQAKFESTSVEYLGDDKAKIKGKLTLRGVTKDVVIDAKRIGGGKDPWGGYRQGFEGSTKFKLADFGIPMNLGPASEEVEIILSVEGIRK